MSQPVAWARLCWRVMYNAEVTTPLLDDGNSGDWRQGRWDLGGAKNPAKRSRQDRWCAGTSPGGRHRRIRREIPGLRRSAELAAYCGTVVNDPSLTKPAAGAALVHPGPRDRQHGRGHRCAMFYGRRPVL